MSQSFEDLEVWQISVEICIQIYQLSTNFPNTEKYGLSDQIRRSCTSVSANIAEGHGRYTRKDFTHFLYQARGSLMETRSHLLIAERLFSLQPDTTAPILQNLSNLSVKLNNLIHAINNRRTNVERSKP